MKRLLLAGLISLVTLIATTGGAQAGLNIDISESTCSVVGPTTLHLDNMSVPGFGLIWVDLRWDPNSLVFFPLNAGYMSPLPTGCGSGHAPVVSNLSVPPTVNVNENFCISYNYCDPDGLTDVKEHHILMSDGTDAVINATGSGHFNQCIFYFAAPGTYQVQVYVIDREGLQSNVLSTQVTAQGGTSCGGFVGLVCPQGQVCDITIPNACHGADLPGLCKTVPSLCPQVGDYVCGCDGVTYVNDCFRLRAGVQFAYKGACI